MDCYDETSVNCRIVITRGTTPDIYAEIPEDVSLTGIREVWITLVQTGKTIADFLYSNGGVIIVDQSLKVRLSQEETLSLSDKYSAKIGIRILYENGRAISSESPEEVEVTDVVKGGIIK